ncbi:MAG: PASTA domain-containing protein [Rikenellaceae bacterium]|nr:PASTA domain-containing protein [Rikenellaceae bacterium]
MKSFWSWLKRHTILYHLAMIALLFLGLAVVAFVAMALGTRHSARRTVPDFVGLQLNDAEYFAGRRDLQIIVNDSLHVAAYPGGVVLDQLPKGGVVVKPGRKVYVTINSSRQRMVAVPYVAGRSLRQAKNMLETAGLTIDHLEYAEDIATNYVLAEYINGEEVLEESELQAEMGSGVVLRVGVSAADTATAAPQVLGRSLFEAKSRLWESGLNIGEIIFDEGMPALERNRAKVYRQSVLPTEAVAYGARVSLHLTLDAAKVDSMIVLEEQRIEEALRAKMEADSIAKAEQRLLDSIANVEKSQPQQQMPQAQDDFFF